MKHLSTFFMITILFIACQEQKKLKQHTSHLALISEKVVDSETEGLYTGEVYDTFDNGAIRMKGHYVEGQKEGMFEWRNESGELIKEERYEQGELKFSKDKSQTVLESIEYVSDGQQVNKYGQKFLMNFMEEVQREEFDLLSEKYLYYDSPYIDYDVLESLPKLFSHFYGAVQSFELIEFKEHLVDDIIQLGVRVKVTCSEGNLVYNINFIETGEDTIQLFDYSMEPNGEVWPFFEKELTVLEGYLAEKSLTAILQLLPDHDQLIGDEQKKTLQYILDISGDYQFHLHQLVDTEEGLVLQVLLRAKIEDEHLAKEYQYLELQGVYQSVLSDKESIQFNFTAFNLEAVPKKVNL